MWRMVRKLVTAAGVVAVCGIALAGTIATVLARPDPLFPYRAAQGRLQLWSDRPFAAADAQRVLADVEARLARSPLNDSGMHRAVIANEPWHRRAVFLWNGGAAGVNYYPLTRNVFIRHSDIAADRVYGASGRMADPPRTLAYYIAHEIGHTLTQETIGFGAYRALPRWIREGLADYIAFGSNVDADALLAALRRGDPTLDPASGNYARYRLLVAWLLDKEGWTTARLLHARLPQSEAERIVLRAP